MRFTLAAVLLAAGCAGAEKAAVRAPIRVKLAVVAARDAGGRSAELARALVRGLERHGAKAVALDDSGSLAAGSELTLGSLSDPRMLAELRSSTGADAVILLSRDSGGTLDAAAADARTGDVLARKAARGPEGVEAAARALALLWAERRKAKATKPDETVEDIPVP